MKTRNIEIVVAPGEPHFVGDGFRVHNFIPGKHFLDRERMNPFIMMDYGKGDQAGYDTTNFKK